jgi:hypothetical protein
MKSDLKVRNSESSTEAFHGMMDPFCSRFPAALQHVRLDPSTLVIQERLISS